MDERRNLLDSPVASVVICTRNRGGLVVEAVESVLANTYSSFELLLLDQSTNLETEEAAALYGLDTRFRYLHSDTVGTGVSRHLGLLEARGKYVLYTDDDCTVERNWVETIVRIFEESEETAVIFSSVTPAEYDTQFGVIPSYEYDEERTISSLPGYYRSIGMGAGMSVRRDAVLGIGGFDKHLGPGSPFKSGEDHDIAVRALLKGWSVRETKQVAVTHYGYRTLSQFRELTGRDWFSIGAVYAKSMKAGNPSVIVLLVYNLLVRGIWLPLTLVFQFKKPQGFKRSVYLLRGFFAGLKTPVKKDMILYELRQPAEA